MASRKKFSTKFGSLIITLIILIFACPVNADHVKPSDRVSNHINIRKYATANSDAVSRLLKGETAELIDSVPYFYKIRHQGITGYVSKRWSIVVPSDATAILSTKGEDLIVGSWNIKWFGDKDTDVHNYQRIADIVSKFDVLAIQELKGDHFHDRLDKIVSELRGRNMNYAYLYSVETGYKNNPDRNHPTMPKHDYSGRFAFMWDTDRIDILPLQRGANYKFVSEPAINNAIFRQVPIYADFKVKNSNGFDFRIMATHTVENKKLNLVRRAEIQYIHYWLLNQIQSASNLEKNIIVIGNFNSNPSKQPHHFNDIISGTDKYRVLFEAPLITGEPLAGNKVQHKDNQTSSDYFKRPVYKHALVSHETSYALPTANLTSAAGNIGKIEFEQEKRAETDASRNELFKAAPDHGPIWFKLDYNAQDKD